MKVEQVLMVTIKPLSYQFFERYRRLPKSSRKRQVSKNFIWISEFFFIPNSLLNAWIFCFAILSSNLSGRFMHLLRRYMHLLTFIVNKTSSVYRYAAFPVAMLYNLSLSVWLNGFIIWNRFITPCRRYYETSSFFFSSSISNDDVIIVICKKWDSAHVCLAEIELVIYVMPNWLQHGWSAP